MQGDMRVLAKRKQLEPALITIVVLIRIKAADNPVSGAIGLGGNLKGPTVEYRK